ncbi:nitroreductase family protein [Streptomyces sp. NPDC001714]|uniref:nitroreductase family protein n=1 Tax=Streptomyces sp. NPDC001714 TaxID=3364603 RepID=UPI0036986336
MPLIPSEEISKTVAEVLRSGQGTTGVSVDVVVTARSDHDPAATGRRLAEAAAGRRSVREYAPRPLPLADITELLDIAADFHLQHWPRGLFARSLLVPRVAAFQVSGGAPGLYTRDSVSGRLQHRLAPAWLKRLPDRYADAPGILLISGPQESALPGTYRSSLVEASALGYAAWLGARTLGLGAVPFGASSNEYTEDLPPGVRHLFTLALGFPLEAT